LGKLAKAIVCTAIILALAQMAVGVEYKETLAGKQITFELSQSYNVSHGNVMTVNGLTPFKVYTLNIEDYRHHLLSSVGIIDYLDPGMDTAELSMEAAVGGSLSAQEVMSINQKIYTETIDGKKGANGSGYSPKIRNPVYFAYFPVDKDTLGCVGGSVDDTVFNEILKSIHVS
jgi:hypothetical protein